METALDKLGFIDMVLSYFHNTACFAVHAEHKKNNDCTVYMCYKMYNLYTRLKHTSFRFPVVHGVHIMYSLYL